MPLSSKRGAHSRERVVTIHACTTARVGVIHGLRVCAWICGSDHACGRVCIRDATGQIIAVAVMVIIMMSVMVIGMVIGFGIGMVIGIGIGMVIAVVIVVMVVVVVVRIRILREVSGSGCLLVGGVKLHAMNCCTSNPTLSLLAILIRVPPGTFCVGLNDRVSIDGEVCAGGIVAVGLHYAPVVRVVLQE